MKTAFSLAALALIGATLGGCAVVPAEPYGPPVVAYAPPPVVVVRPAYPAYRYHGYYGRDYRYWR